MYLRRGRHHLTESISTRKCNHWKNAMAPVQKGQEIKLMLAKFTLNGK